MLSWIRFLSNVAEIWRAAPKVGILFEFEKSYVDFLNFDLFGLWDALESKMSVPFCYKSVLWMFHYSRGLFVLFSDYTWCFYMETYISYVEFFTCWSFLNHNGQLKYSALSPSLTSLICLRKTSWVLYQNYISYCWCNYYGTWLVSI